MNVTDFKIEGLNELIKEFSKLGEAGTEKLRQPSIDAAEIVLNKARSKIHNRTGDLSRGLRVAKPAKKSKNPYKIYARVTFKKGVNYAVPLELGHRLWFMGHKTNRDVEEKPFLRPAADESKTEVANIMANAMNKILEEWGD